MRLLSYASLPSSGTPPATPPAVEEETATEEVKTEEVKTEEVKAEEIQDSEEVEKYWETLLINNQDTSYYVIKNRVSGLTLSNRYYSKSEAEKELQNFKNIIK